MSDGPSAGAARWIVRGALLFLLTFTNLHDLWSPDVVPNTLFAWTLIRQGNVDFDEFTEIPRDTYFFRACGPRQVTQIALHVPLTSPRSPGGPPPPGPEDRACSIFPPGISLLALPILAPFVIAGVPPAEGGTVIRAGHLAAALIETVAALILWSVLRRFVSPRWSLGLILLYWLATSVRTVAAQALWQHSGVHLTLAAALWLVLEERVTIRRELIAGILMGLGTTVRQTTALISVGIARLPWPRVAIVRFRVPIAFAVGWGIGLVPLLVYNTAAFGNALEQGYGEKPFDAPVLTGLCGLLISPSRGILLYEPWIVAAFVALALSWGRSGLVALRFRGIAVAWAWLLLTYARYAEWWGGRVFGPRFLDDLAPAMIAAVAWGVSEGLLARTWARVAFWVAAGWSLLLFNAAALVYDPNGWDTVPVNVNFDPSKLFAWSDPQWLNVLASLGTADARVFAAAVLSALVLAALLLFELRSPPRA